METEEIEKLLARYLIPEEGLLKGIASAMNYSMTAGGKRLRPAFLYEAYRAFGGSDTEVVAPFMAAIELIHNYSLCHDDLPAMDNDDYRRGQLTTHRKYGEAMGILAGDGLLTYAFEVATYAFDAADAAAVARALRVLAHKSGISGMLGGQAVDVESEEKNIDLYTITFIHKNKTAALIEAALMIGGILAGASEEDVERLETLGEHIGIAFQIQDDILDVTGDFEQLGKSIGSDDKNNKTTYLSLVGQETSEEELGRLFDEAKEIIQGFDGDTAGLSALVDSLIGRKK